MAFHLAPRRHNNWLKPFGDDLMTRILLDIADQSPRSSATVEPSHSFEDEEKTWHLEIEMPGVARENISIQVDGYNLIVKGKRFRKQLGTAKNTVDKENKAEMKKSEKSAKEVQQSPSLIYSFEIGLPQNLNLNAIKADHSGDGLLILNIPKKINKGMRTIQIGQ